MDNNSIPPGYLAAPGPGEQIPPQQNVLPAVMQEQVHRLESQLLGGERDLRRQELAAAVGVTPYTARRLWRALGFANVDDDEIAFTAEDERAMHTIVNLVRQGRLSEDAAISVIRALGQMTDRIAVWQIEAMVEDMVLKRGITDAEARVELSAALPDLVQPLQDLLGYAWRRQLAAGVQRMAVRAQSGIEASRQGLNGQESDAPLPLARAVGFADLVSYTTLSRRMSERTLAQLVQRFETRCAEIIAAGGGRLVKTIGDEVLYTTETPAAGAEISLALEEAFARDELLPLSRVAMVWGRVLSRLGDIYGPTVNLASRLTALAEPGTVLVDGRTADALQGDPRYVLQPLRTETIRGIGEVQPVLLRRGRGSRLVVTDGHELVGFQYPTEA